MRAIARVPRVLRRPLVASFMDRRTRGLLDHALGVAATLDREAGLDAMKDGPFVEPVVHVLEEVFHRDGRAVLVKLQGDVPHRGGDDDHRIARRGRRGRGRRLEWRGLNVGARRLSRLRNEHCRESEKNAEKREHGEKPPDGLPPRQNRCWTTAELPFVTLAGNTPENGPEHAW